MLKTYNIHGQGGTNKRSLKCTNLSDHNSFATLDNAEIVHLTSDMGINIDCVQFDSVEIMRDLEVARHSLDKTRNNVINNPNEGIVPMEAIQENQILALEWLEEDSESKIFTMVESKKEKEITDGKSSWAPSNQEESKNNSIYIYEVWRP
jgi:hypothetical protein